MRIAVFDNSWPGWPTAGEYAKVQLASLLCAMDRRVAGAEVLFVTGSGRLPVLPPAVPTGRLRTVLPPPAPALCWSERLRVRAGGIDRRQRDWSRWVAANGIDVAVSYYPQEWWRPGREGICFWIPDFQHLRLPQYFKPAEIQARSDDYRRFGELADRIIVSSEAVRGDFARFAPDLAGKARVFQFPSLLAFQTQLPACEPDAVLARFGIAPGFFLVVNQFFAHKNHRLVLEAMAGLRGRGVAAQVVMIGAVVDYRDRAGRTLSALLGRLAELRLEGAVKILGFVDADVRDALMRSCRAVIQPSECEGWNTTVEDARCLGKPVLASDHDVHREQVPDAFAFFPVDAAATLAEAMNRAVSELPYGVNETREATALAAAGPRRDAAAAALMDLCCEAAATGRTERGR